MILHAIELANTGRFLDRVRIGPFTSGLNILAAPNEFGKTTVLTAAVRALFDRHNSKSEEILSLRPIGTELAPRVAVEFETREGRFRIEKIFINPPAKTPASLLSRWNSNSSSWQLLADAEAADRRTHVMLHSSLPGKGASKPEHWGLFSYLMARQGEPADWPEFSDASDVAQRIRSRLARVELDPIIENLRARLAEKADALITTKGVTRANSDLEKAEMELEAAAAELAGIRQQNAKLETERQRYQQAVSTVAQLEKEHAEKSTTTTTLSAQAAAAERLTAALAVHNETLSTAREKLTAIATDADTLARHQAEAKTTQSQITAAQTASAAAEKQHAELAAQLAALTAERPQHETRLQTLRDDLQRTQTLLKHRRQTAEAEALARQLAKAEKHSAELDSLENEKLKLPAITPPKLRKLEELDAAIREKRAQLQALGLTIDLTPDQPATVTANNTTTPLPARTPARFTSPHTFDLHLEGWGRIAIRSGSKETQNLATELAAAEKDFAAALEAASVATLEAARNAVATRKDLDARLKTATAALTAQLDDHESIAALREAVAAATQRAAATAATLLLTASEQARSTTELEADEARLTEAISAAEKTLRQFDKQLDTRREDERRANKTAAETLETLRTHQTRLRTLEAQIADLSARHAAQGGIEAAKTAAQITFVQAEARVAATKSELPPDYEKLPERNRRAAAALQQLANELQARRAERDQAQGTLETLGAQGLYTRETELEEKKSDALLRRDTARAQAWSARIAHDLIQHRKQAATKSVLAPLEARLTAAFAEITGDATRRVYLDEHLQIAGLGRTRDETHPYALLSQGAKEQLLLCLRLAIAQELATDEPQLLILDDVLVNTDPIRQERILDTLAAQTQHLQILILTCHPDRYRGVGNSLSLQAFQTIEIYNSPSI